MTKARDLANASTALSAVSATELAFVDGVTSAIQTQLDAKTAKSTLTTTGDIYYASAANTPARLGIGSSAQVLTVSGGIPAWATPSAGATFIGAFAYSTTPQTLGNNSRVAQALQAELYDTNTFHDNTTDNSRMTIPSGQNGKYLIGAMVSFTNNVTGYRSTSIRKNGSDAVEFYGFNAGAAGGGPFGSIILDLVATDYIEVYGRQGSGGNLDTATDTYTGGQTGVFLYIQKVG
jgi:hypothetical protein